MRAVKCLSAMLLVTAGCYSFTVLGRAHTVPPHDLEVLAAPGATATATLNSDPNIRPALELGARYGVADGIDVGLRIGDYGAAAATRVQLQRGDRIEVLLAPGLAYTLTDKLALELPCLVGINLDGGDQIVLAPRVVYQARFGVGGLDHPAQFGFIGASAGFVWQVGAHVALMPELAVLTGIYSEPGFTSFTQAGPALQAAVGVLWDH